MAKKAVIIGVSSQDGSYLADLLLEKGYEVTGTIRRSTNYSQPNLEHLYGKIKIEAADLIDGVSIENIIKAAQPDEVYNIAAMSIPADSWSHPLYTGEVTALGPVRVFEAVHKFAPQARVYQATSREIFGNIEAESATESTSIDANNPYGIAKAYAHMMIRNYRESYGMFVCGGILFNHETVASFMPMFCKSKHEDEFDIKPISEIVKFDETLEQYQSKPVTDLQVWGKEGWVDVKHASAYPHDIKGNNKQPRFVNSRIGAYMATSSHVAFMEGGEEKETRDIKVGDKLEVIALPFPLTGSSISAEEAELMGLLIGDGSITYAKRGIGLHGKFTNSSPEVRQYFNDLWSKVTGGSTVYYPSKSGFNPNKIVGQLRLINGNDWLRSLDLYNQDRTKRVPKAILNSSSKIMQAFLEGYNMADGLKSNPCTYEFKNFKTNSFTLASGLWYLIERTTGQKINLSVETKPDGRLFYSLNILSPTNNFAKQEIVREMITVGETLRGISRETGISRKFIQKINRGGQAAIIHHLRKPQAEVKKIIDLPNYDGWFYDLETSSGEFHCGVGKIHVHNSPRRSLHFVTRKISAGVACIKNNVKKPPVNEAGEPLIGSDGKLHMGDISNMRDWGYAKEYVEAMWLMLQNKEPKDYVIGTNTAHSVKEALKIAFEHVGLDWEKYTVVDKKFFRPTEIKELKGDYSLAKKELGWEPKITFEGLIKLMVDADLKKFKN